MKQVSGSYSQWYYYIALWGIPTLALQHSSVGNPYIGITT